MKTAAALVTLLCSLPLIAASASQAFHGERSNLANVVYRHRRHHIRSAQGNSLNRRASTKSTKKCKSKSGSKKSGSKKSGSKKGGSTSKSGSSSNSTTTGSSSSGKASKHCPSNGLSVNGVCIGMLPDGGTDGGPKNTMSQLNSLISTTGKKHAYFGQYAQVHDPSFDGGQLKQVMDDLKSSGAIFQPAVMPTGGWKGFTADDDSAAQQVCKVMKEFTDEGIETWLRFAHECNWYITDGTYQGTLEDCKVGFQTVAQACKTIAPEVKMFWTPNMGDESQYDAMWPGAEHVDYLGIDFYPKQGSDLDTAFVQAMQPLHDKYTTSSGPFFAIGETGLAYEGSDDEKVQFMKSQLDAVKDMPQMVGTAWFNYIKNSEAGNFKILDPDNDTVNTKFLSLCSK